ncbi:Probable LRR receptor-like serine/threonine-protein kinase At1g56140 [Linum perenne]
MLTQLHPTLLNSLLPQYPSSSSSSSWPAFRVPQSSWVMVRRFLQVSRSSYSLMSSSALFFFAGVLVVLAILLILLTVFWKFMKLNHTTTKLAKKDSHESQGGGVASEVMSGTLRTIRYFDYQTLKKATKNFHPDNLLGSGGFGPVYRGKLRDGRVVAVKRLALDKSHQGEAEFLAEVRMITSIQHRNLVRLIGCCSDGDQRLLVYEYLKNRSLDLIVYGNHFNNQFMDWNTRFQIILGIARGLQYLHEDSPLRIVHRDIKASNVLLDEKFQPRISDFGLARFFPDDQTYLSTTFAGTLGYTAPEYAIRGELSEKADIYSYGVLILEIICCRKNTDLNLLPAEQQYLPDYAWKLYEKNKVQELIDPRLRQHGIMERDVVHVIHVAFACLQPLANMRPPMSEVVAMLTCKVERGSTHVIKPAFLEKRRRAEGSFSWDVISEAFPSPFRSLESQAASRS